MKSYYHLARWAMEQPWAVTPRMLNIIQGILTERVRGDIPSADVIAGRIAEERDVLAADARRGASRSGAVAVLPIYGVIMQRADALSEMSGGVSTEAISKQFRALMADPGIGTIVLDVDSPGGGVYGVQELAEEIYRARGQKRIVAVANSMAASAAYWIATAAEEVIVTPGGEVGSIGCYMVHEDWSGAYEQAGVAPTIIQFGGNKTLGNSMEPLSEMAREHLQGRVNQYGEAFVAAVARQRGVSKAVVARDFGQGMVFGAAEAVRLKMADRVATLDETVTRLVGGRHGSAARSLAADIGPLTAEFFIEDAWISSEALDQPTEETEAPVDVEEMAAEINQAEDAVTADGSRDRRHRHSRSRVLTP